MQGDIGLMIIILMKFIIEINFTNCIATATVIMEYRRDGKMWIFMPGFGNFR